MEKTFKRQWILWKGGTV